MSEEDLIPIPRFTGIFIPVELLELPDLSYLELILLSWIDALYCTKHKGCFASNSYLADKLQSQPNTIAKALTELRKKELIEDVSYDGRTRVIRSLVHRLIDKTQSKSELDKNPKGLDKNPRVYGEKSKSHLYESKVENDDDDRKKNFENLDLDSSKGSSDLIATKTNGTKYATSESEIYLHFCKLPQYSTSIVQEAIQRTRYVDSPINNILKYLESICESILQEQNKPKKDPEPKSKKTKNSWPTPPPVDNSQPKATWEELEKKYYENLKQEKYAKK